MSMSTLDNGRFSLQRLLFSHQVPLDYSFWTPNIQQEVIHQKTIEPELDGAVSDDVVSIFTEFNFEDEFFLTGSSEQTYK